MREIIRTDDAVLVSFVETLFGEAGITVHILDRNMSALYGAPGQIMQRIAVGPEDWSAAKRLLTDAGLEKWIIETGDT